jgi:hypothetical protein
MMPVALFSSLLGTEDACLPVGRQAETSNYQLCANYILTSSAYCQSVAANQKKCSIRNNAADLIFGFITTRQLFLEVGVRDCKN